ncbi:MAG: hypothetical protein ACOY42_07690 [Pseudomonadota bacterium]
MIDTRLCELLGMELPILQAPMAGVQGGALAAAVSEAGGLPCAMLDARSRARELATGATAGGGHGGPAGGS